MLTYGIKIDADSKLVEAVLGKEVIFVVSFQDQPLRDAIRQAAEAIVNDLKKAGE